MAAVPSLRILPQNEAPPRKQGKYVLYWSIAQRRLTWNFALQRAAEWARTFDLPLLILEPLRCDYPWACDRFHRFVLQGMAHNAAMAAERGVAYYPYVEPEPGAGQGLLSALAQLAAVVVTDEFPCFFLPRMVRAAAARLDVRLEAVDSNGLLPLAAAEREFHRAFDFRRFLQRGLAPHLNELPLADPLNALHLPRLAEIPGPILRAWPPAGARLLGASPEALAALPCDHAIGPAAMAGGGAAAQAALTRFVERSLPRYADGRNEPDDEVSSGLSPYLHFGHLSAAEVFAAIARREDWSPGNLTGSVTGSKEGWWGMSPAAEGFLDQLVTWRELGYNFCARRADYDRYESLPDWAQATLADHARDRRPHLYTHEEFASATTHDPLWNAAQTQLVREGRMHNYLRMLWAKKILEWSPTPREALATMIDLNNRYAVDGRNPNSYSGIFWTLGRFDRPWAPERPIFGRIRYMSSENTARKLHIKNYLRRYAPVPTPSPTLFDR